MTKTLGKKIKKRLKRIGISQRKLAIHFKVSEQHLCAVLGGYQKNQRLNDWFLEFCEREEIKL